MGSVTADLLQFIGLNEVLTSSELLKRLQTSGIDSAYARQLLHRKADAQNVWRSECLVLPSGGRLFARNGFQKTEEFRQKCLPILKELRPGIARAMQAIVREEIILRSRAELLLASPLISDKANYPSYQNEVSVLTELGISRSEGGDGVLERLAHEEQDGDTTYAIALRAYARFTTETALANLLFEQFRRENWISWKSKVPDQTGVLAQFNNFQFRATAFSHLRPMLRFNKTEKPKPTPVVLDVFAKTCEIYDVESFIERIVRAGQNKNRKLTFLGIIAAYDFDSVAWQLAKNEGLLAINLRQHFGEFAFEALVQVQELLRNVAGEPEKANDADVKKLADTLAELKTNPYVVDLRSLGFESVSGLIGRTKGYENIHLNLKATTESGEEREIDVCGEKNGGEELLILECKAEAINKVLDPSYVRKFYTETVPAYLRTKSGRTIRECRAEIWTTGQVGEDARQALAEISLKPFVKPALLGHDDVKKQIPSTLSSCKRLLEAISIN